MDEHDDDCTIIEPGDSSNVVDRIGGGDDSQLPQQQQYQVWACVIIIIINIITYLLL